MLTVAVAAIFRTELLTAAGQCLVEDDGIQKADVAVVLGGDEFGTRILRAGQLARAGYVPYVLVSSPMRLLQHDSDITIPFAVNKGNPPAVFRPFPHNLNSTRSEAALIDDYLRKQGVKKMLLITSNYHTRRAARLMRQYAGGIQVVAVPASDPSFSPSTWWKTRDGQKTFLLEWMKTIAAAVGD